MSSKTFAVIVRCWYNRHADATQLQVVRVDTAEEAHLNDSNFLLRISIDEAALVVRCFIRHLTSGREAHVQGGAGLQAFIKDCLLRGSEPDVPDEHETPV